MKTALRLTLLLSLIFVCGIAMAQSSDKEYKTFYKKINKDFSLPKKTSEKKTYPKNDSNCIDSLKNNIEVLETALKELDKIADISVPQVMVDDRPEKRYIYNPSEEKKDKRVQFTPPTPTKQDNTQKPTPRLTITPRKTPKAEETTIAKPQPTENKSIGTERISVAATTEKQSPIIEVKEPASKPTTSITAAKEEMKKIIAPESKNTVASGTKKTISGTIEQILATKPEVRAVSTILESGSAMKKYNVVIATLSTKQRSDRLKAIFFAETNEKIWIVKNEQNLHHFIMGSFDTEEEAVNKRNDIIRYYTSKYSSDNLMDKYGIPFIDTWILVNE